MTSFDKFFATQPELESTGVWMDYGDFRVLIARAGGGNKPFLAALRKIHKQNKKAIEFDVLDEKHSDALLHKAYAQHIVLQWEGVTDKADQPIPFSQEKCVELFAVYPEFFREVNTMASSLANFRTEEIEAAGKNS